MGNLRACFVVATLALSAACGDDGGNSNVDAAITIVDAPPDSKVWFDAPPQVVDFSCAGNAAPTTATAQVTLSGTVQRVFLNGTMPAIAALANADLDACDATANACTGPDNYGNDTSDAGGEFSIGPIDTGMTPLDAYITMTATDSRDVYVYPASPFVADQGMIPVLTFDPDLIPLLGAFTDCTQNDVGNGIIGLAVTDCVDAPITDSANLEIIIKQGGNVVTTTTVIDLGGLIAQAAGTYLVCNVPANATTEVGATYNGMAMRAHNVKVVAGATTATLIRPGY